MQDLRVIGVEGGSLLVASDGGDRFRLPIDEVLQSKLRQSSHPSGSGRKLAPREIQAHIRAGMSAEDVAELTGASLEHIRRYEGPVLAEREYVVETALGVPVHTAADTDQAAEGTTFGSAIRERLRDLDGIGERWSSWKDDEQGWIVKLTFTANDVDHDARWTFDPKKLALAPLNREATTLSQQGEVAGAMIPRLRAVTGDERTPDQTRFDSGAFMVSEPEPGEVPRIDAVPFAGGATGAPAAHNQTADLLEALRRRRGERESAATAEEHADTAPGAPAIRLVDVPMDEFTGESLADTRPQPHPAMATKPRRGRPAMPSWDEIVFGARSDDDPA